LPRTLLAGLLFHEGTREIVDYTRAGTLMGQRSQTLNFDRLRQPASVLEVFGPSSASRFRIQGQTGDRQAVAAHWLRRAHAPMLVHAGPLPGSGNLLCSGKRAVMRKSQPARIEISVAVLIMNGR